MRPEDSQPNSSTPSSENTNTQPNPIPATSFQPNPINEDSSPINNQSPLPPITQSPVSQSSGDIANEPTSSSLITDAASFKADLPPVIDDVTVKKSHRGVKLFVLLICVIALGAIGYYFFFMQNNPSSNNLPAILNSGLSPASKKISQDDLVLERVRNTSYLRPQQWVAQEEVSGGGFGTSEKSHEKPIAAVTMSEGAVEPKFANASADLYQKLRDQTMQSLKEQLELQNKMQTSTICTSSPTSTAEPDTLVTDSIVGLATVVMKCTRDDGEYIVKSRFVIGTDGGQRTIAVAAVQKQWDENNEIFQKILNSVQVSTNL